MKDLYTQLGVRRNATLAEIKRAYRARAKAAHPDQGGSTEQFGALTLAYDTLRDQQRREHYDRTGEAKQPEPDNAHAAILSCLAQAFEMAMAQALEMDSQNPLTRNVLEMAKSRLRVDLKKATEHALQMRKNADLAQRASDKFIRKAGANQISAIFTSKADRFWASAKAAEASVDTLLRSLAFLDDYSFTPDKQAPAATGTVFHSVDGAAFRASFFDFDHGRNQ